jgi:hypothetical protein
MTRAQLDVRDYRIRLLMVTGSLHTVVALR